MNGAGFERDELDDQDIFWTSELHGDWGNLLLNGGAVVTVQNFDVKQAILAELGDESNTHFLLPR